ncbi:MAG: hypothetical protein V4667_12315 [Bacteroidota bacterium]
MITVVRKYFTFVLACSILFFSCGKKGKEEAKGEPVAKVYDKYLYQNDLTAVLPSDLKGNDSVSFVKDYIQNWILRQLWLNKAENNLDDELKDVEKQLEDYRVSLITYVYEKELINQKLDTIVNETEIAEYYTNHPQNFLLKDNIIKVVYVKVGKNAPKIDKLKEWYKNDDEKVKQQLSEYCFQFAENFYLNENSWLLFDDLLKEIPIRTYDQEQFLQNNRLIELQDSLSLYFVNIKGFKIKESISPLSFEKENIKNIILNKRKLTLINSLKKDLYTNAQNNKEIEIY